MRDRVRFLNPEAETPESLSSSSSEPELVELQYDVPLGRFHAFEVKLAKAEHEEGLAFAETFGIGVSLYFKVGKHLLCLLLGAALLQLPALVWYLRGGGGGEKGKGGSSSTFPFFREAAGSSGIGGGVLARCSMAAVADESGRGGAVVACFAALASLFLFVGGAAGRFFVRKNVSAMRRLIPRPEHYALLFRDVDETATAARVLRDCELIVKNLHENNIVRVAVHHAVRPALSKALETMKLEESEVMNENFFEWSRLSVFRTWAAERKRQRQFAEDQLLERQRGPAVAVFVVFETPRAARRAAKDFLLLEPGSAPSLGKRPRPSLAPSPADIIWENLEVSKTERYCKRFLVRCGTIVIVLFGLFAALALRGAAIDEANIAVLSGAHPNATTSSVEGATANNASAAAAEEESSSSPLLNEVQDWYQRSAEAYVTRRPSPRRRSVLMVLTVVILNFVLRFVVRRGSVLEAHSTRTTEQSAALASYFASTTLNTFACYAVAAWRSATRFKHGKIAVWYAEVGGYLLMNLLWEAFAPPCGAVFRAAARRALGVDLVDQRERVKIGRRATLSQGQRQGKRLRRRPGSSPTCSNAAKNDDRRGERTPICGGGGGESTTFFGTTTSLNDDDDDDSGAAAARRAPDEERTQLRGRRPPPEGMSFRPLETLSLRARGRKVLESLKRYVATPGWDPVARSADALRVFTIGAVFGAGFPLMPWLSGGCLLLMLAHDKWALLRERSPPPLLGPHLARTAATLAPLVAPFHALLAIWTWTDLGRPLVCPERFKACALTTVTWPLALEVAFFVGALLGSAFFCRPLRHNLRRTFFPPENKARRRSFPPPLEEIKTGGQTLPFFHGGGERMVRDDSLSYSVSASSEDPGPLDDDDDGDDSLVVYDDEPLDAAVALFASQRRPSEDGLAPLDGPPWREARLTFQRKGIPYLYDVYDDARPLERERHPDFFRRWSNLESTEVVQTVLSVFTPPRGVSDACDPRQQQGLQAPRAPSSSLTSS